MILSLRKHVARRSFIAAWALSFPFVLSSCVNIPKPPDDLASRHLRLPSHYANANAAQAALLPADWVAQFHSPKLSQLVRAAIKNNPDLHAAAARWQEAEAQIALSRANLLPQITGSFNPGQNVTAASSGFGSRTITTYDAQLSLSWQVDLWGRLRDQTAQTIEQALASSMDYRYARFSLAASVARAYFSAIAARRQLAIDRDLVKVNQRTAKITADKVSIGAGTQLDSEESKGNVALAQAAVQNDEQSLAEARRAIDVLLGHYPDGKLNIPDALPTLPGPVPTGLPSQLLERRPDVVAADHRVAAAFHLVESAKAAQLPQLNLNESIAESFMPSSTFWSLAGGLLQPLYAGGQIHGGIKLRQAQQREAVANYVSVGIKAFKEVESALSNARYLKQREASLKLANDRLGNASRIAEDRYNAGIITILNLTQVRTQYFNTRAQLLAVRADRLNQRVNLYLALGGPPLSKKESAKVERAATQPISDGVNGIAPPPAASTAPAAQTSPTPMREKNHGQ